MIQFAPSSLPFCFKKVKIKIEVNSIREMVSFRLVTSVGHRKNSESP